MANETFQTLSNRTTTAAATTTTAAAAAAAATATTITTTTKWNRITKDNSPAADWVTAKTPATTNKIHMMLTVEKQRRQ